MIGVVLVSACVVICSECKKNMRQDSALWENGKTRLQFGDELSENGWQESQQSRLEWVLG